MRTIQVSNVKTKLLLLLFVMVMVLSSCMESDDNKKNPTSILKFYMRFPDEKLENRIQEALESYSNINIEFLYNSKPVGYVEQWKKEHSVVPDIILDNRSHLEEYLKYDFTYDISDLVKSTGLNIESIDKQLLDDVRSYSDSGELIALPYRRSALGLLYNKNVFDIFNVPYPGDNITWEEVYELTKKLTGTMNGIQYQGFEGFQTWMHMINQREIPYFGEDGLPAINSEEWIETFTFASNLHKIAGDVPGGQQHNRYFSTKGNVAMTAWYIPFESLPFEWDIAAFPTFRDNPGVGPNLDYEVLLISPTSKNKEAAAMVIATLLSDEFQLENSRLGYGSSLSDMKILSEYGLNIPSLHNKNVQSLFTNKIAQYRKRFSYGELYDAFISAYHDEATPSELLNSVQEGLVKRAIKRMNSN